MVTEPNSEEAEIKLDSDAIEDLRSQLIQIHDHILDGLEVFYKFVDNLFSRFPGEIDMNYDGSGGGCEAAWCGTDSDEENDVNREAPMTGVINIIFTKKNQIQFQESSSEEAGVKHIKELKNIKSITPVKSVSPVKSIKEVVGLYELTPEQASRLRELNEISETRSQSLNRIVSMTSRPLRLG